MRCSFRPASVGFLMLTLLTMGFPRALAQEETGQPVSYWKEYNRLPTAAEQKALTALHAAPADARAARIEEVVKAGGWLDTMPLEYYLQAAVGLDPAMRTRVINQVLKPRLAKKDLKSAEYRAALRGLLVLDAGADLPESVLPCLEFLAGPATEGMLAGKSIGPWYRQTESIARRCEGQAVAACDLLSPQTLKAPEACRSALARFAAALLMKLDDEAFVARLPMAGHVAATSHSGIELFQRIQKHGGQARTLATPGVVKANPEVEKFIAEVTSYQGDSLPFCMMDGRSFHIVLGLGEAHQQKVYERLMAVVKRGAAGASFPWVYVVLLNKRLSPADTEMVFDNIVEPAARSKSPTNASDQFPKWLEVLEPAQASVVVDRLLELELDKAYSYFAAKSLVKAVSRLSDERVGEVSGILSKRVSAGDALLVDALAQIASRLSPEKREAARKLMEIPFAEGNKQPATADSLKRLAEFAQGAARTKPPADKAAQLFNRLLDDYIPLVGPGHNSPSYSDKQDYPLSYSVTLALTDLFPSLDAAGKTAAIERIEKTLTPWGVTWRTDVLTKTLASSAATLSPEQADRTMALLLAVLDRDVRQHRATPDITTIFLRNRPFDEQGKRVRAMIPVYFGGKMKTNSHPAERDELTRLAREAASRVPPPEAFAMVEEILKVFNQFGDFSDQALLEGVVRCLPKERHAEVRALLEKKREAVDNAGQKAALAKCIEMLPVSLEGEPLAGGLEKLAAAVQKGSNADINNLFHPLEKKLTSGTMAERDTAAPKLLEMLVQSNRRTDLDKPAAQTLLCMLLRPPLSPAVGEKVLRLFASDETFDSRTIAYVHLDGEIPAGLVLELVRKQAAKGTEDSATVLGMLVRHAKKADASVCFQAILDSVPGDLESLTDGRLARLGEALTMLCRDARGIDVGKRCDEAIAAAREEDLAPNRRQARSLFAQSLLAASASNEPGKFLDRLEKLLPSPKEPAFPFQDERGGLREKVLTLGAAAVPAASRRAFLDQAHLKFNPAKGQPLDRGWLLILAVLSPWERADALERLHPGRNLTSEELGTLLSSVWFPSMPRPLEVEPPTAEQWASPLNVGLRQLFVLSAATTRGGVASVWEYQHQTQKAIR